MSGRTIKQMTVGKLTVKIEACEDSESPDAWDFGDVFLGEVSTRWYSIGRKGWSKSTAEPYIPFGEGPWDFDNCDYYELAERADSKSELLAYWEERHRADMQVTPVRLEDLGSNGARLREVVDYDSAHGYVFVKVPWRSELERLAYPDFNAEQMVENLIRVWNMYLQGEVYDVLIWNDAGDIVESIGGIYGFEEAECQGIHLAEEIQNMALECAK